MTKTEIVEKIAEVEEGFSKAAVERIINSFLGHIIEAVKNGEDVVIRGFGAFKAKTLNPRMGRNPQTGESVKVSSKKRMGFKVSASVKKELNPAKKEAPDKKKASEKAPEKKAVKKAKKG